MNVAEMTTAQRSEALVGLALAEYVDAQEREREEARLNEQGRQINVSDAARWATEAAFGHPAARLLDWSVSAVDKAPAQMAEARVTLDFGPWPLTLVFRAWMDDSAQVMADSGALFVRHDCHHGFCDADHVTRVNTLAELGALLTTHGSGDLAKGEHETPTPPKEWSEPHDPRDV
ncbi:hypothetical protein AB0L75_42425 [Streptomyces sp. NPDC052101]|uniref:hypothetical protein n=1 Tax=Streptomyces sp. NPDC052101 TaxID=3155763 RepID=UPI0034246997